MTFYYDLTPEEFDGVGFKTWDGKTYLVKFGNPLLSEDTLIVNEKDLPAIRRILEENNKSLRVERYYEILVFKEEVKWIKKVVEVVII